jgi:hypothetical protein
MTTTHTPRSPKRGQTNRTRPFVRAREAAPVSNAPCSHCGGGRDVRLMRVVPVRGGGVLTVSWCKGCRETEKRWVQHRPVDVAVAEWGS